MEKFKTISEVESDIVADFSVFNDWMDKYEYLIDMGRELPVIEENEKTEHNLIKGCQSRVWLNSQWKEGKLYFSADSDAIITKGIISLLIKVYSGRTPKEILSSDFGFIEKIGLKENLSPTRANGLVSMIKKIRDYAMAYSNK
jgi:cysteine desulfuration protein SufE